MISSSRLKSSKRREHRIRRIGNRVYYIFDKGTLARRHGEHERSPVCSVVYIEQVHQPPAIPGAPIEMNKQRIRSRPEILRRLPVVRVRSHKPRCGCRTSLSYGREIQVLRVRKAAGVAGFVEPPPAIAGSESEYPLLGSGHDCPFVGDDLHIAVSVPRKVGRTQVFSFVVKERKWVRPSTNKHDEAAAGQFRHGTRCPRSARLRFQIPAESRIVSLPFLSSTTAAPPFDKCSTLRTERNSPGPSPSPPTLHATCPSGVIRKIIFRPKSQTVTPSRPPSRNSGRSNVVSASPSICQSVSKTVGRPRRATSSLSDQSEGDSTRRSCEHATKTSAKVPLRFIQPNVARPIGPSYRVVGRSRVRVPKRFG